jgi:thiol-disulfide isomerase/thioredoxin
MKHYTARVSLLGAMAISVAAAAPRAAIEPAQPTWGERVQLIYHSDAPGAKLKSTDTVVAVVTIWFPEDVRRFRINLAPSGGHLQGQITIPDSASFIDCQFVTKDANDGSAAAMIRTPSGNPARGAWQQSMMHPYIQKDYLDRVAKELALYPDNWSAYRDKWFLSYNAADLKDVVKNDMASIERQATNRPLTSLYALSYGHVLLGDEPAARATIREMVSRFPNSWLTANAMQNYEYQSYVQHFTGDGPKEVRRLRIAFVERNVNSWTTWQDLDTFGMGDPLPLGVVEQACESWMLQEPRNPLPYMHLANALQREHVQSERALRNAERALDRLVTGELRLHGDIYGKMTEVWLPDVYKTAAQLALKEGQVAKALAYVKAAETIGRQTSPIAYAEEARIWEELGRVQNAQAALKEAWQRGDKGAYAKLAEMGVAIPVSGSSKETKKAAPAFKAIALDGTPIDSSRLRGKVIVANFWFTGCGPCKAEIPDLNKLASEFEGKDVVFLAFTTDEDQTVLRRFLKEHPFRYTIVPDAGKIASSFGVESYPSHLIVNADGKVESMLVGAGEGRADELKTVIERLISKAGGTE